MDDDFSWAGLIDWDTAFAGEAPEIAWLCEPFLEAGTLASLYSGVGLGKSLLAQDVAAGLAAGRSVLGNQPGTPVDVLYLDFENRQGEVTDRLRDMGYLAADLKRLRYASYPELPPLDTPEGGEHAFRLAAHARASLIIIDTTSRIVAGAENSSDTYADLYRYTLMRLKRTGRTTLRLDHEGKDPERGQRGSSAKGADVDVVWRMSDETGGVFRLVPEKDRANHVAEFRVRRLADPLRHEVVRTPLSPVQMALAENLNQLGVPRTASRKECREALKKSRLGARTEDLATVVRARKNWDSSRDNPSGLSRPRSTGQVGQTTSDLPGQPLGHRGHGLGTDVPHVSGDSPGYSAVQWQSMWDVTAGA